MRLNAQTWTFHGVGCSQEQAFTWRNSMDQGYCPWCKKAVGRHYGGANRHLRACPDKPKNQETT